MSNPSRDYRAEIEVAATRYGLDPDVIEAIVRVESSGRTYAYRYEEQFWHRYLADNPLYDGALPVRVSASYGLMQVMYPVAREHGFDDPPEYLFVPTIGLEYGCKHLRHLLDALHGDLDRALVGYNGGLGNARRTPFQPVHSIYLSRVKSALERVKEEK